MKEQEEHASHLGILVRGLAVGALAMYMLDPDKGRRRRAIVRDKVRRFGNDAARLTQQATRDAGNRLHGVNAMLQHRRSPEAADDLKLIERVRSTLGRCVSHPHAVQVGVRDGTVVLSGPIFQHEAPGLLAAVHAVLGVTEIEDHLDRHMRDDRLPSLQGHSRREQSRYGAINTPAMRFAMLVGGGMLALTGLARRGAGGLALMSAGLGMAVRAVDQESAGAPARAARSALPGALAGHGTPRMATDIGADGTPAGPAGGGERTPSADFHSPSADVPPIGNDGTRAATADPRTSAGHDADASGVPGAEAGGIPRATGNRPPL